MMFPFLRTTEFHLIELIILITFSKIWIENVKNKLFRILLKKYWHKINYVNCRKLLIWPLLLNKIWKENNYFSLKIYGIFLKLDSMLRRLIWMNALFTISRIWQRCAVLYEAKYKTAIQISTIFQEICYESNVRYV